MLEADRRKAAMLARQPARRSRSDSAELARVRSRMPVGIRSQRGERPMPSDQDLSYLDLLAVRALLLWPLLAWALVFFFLLR